MVDCIVQKRDGQALAPEAIRTLCEAYQRDEIPDYQMSAFLMALYFNGMDDSELFALTEAMRASGDTVHIPSDTYTIDKHSTGGVGDKISLVLLPILAALGFGVIKISGRGLGHTGGTIDKLESFPNFRFSSHMRSIETTLRECNIALLCYSDSIVPLDKKLYSLRDVTGTVQSIPLIASSIMSKKLAVSSRTILLDVKVGSGAFMKDRESALCLAKTMKRIGTHAGRDVRCVLSDMGQPLGRAVGNALEVREAVGMLQGEAPPPDVYELVCALAGMALAARGDIQTYEGGKTLVDECIKNGTALEKLLRFITLCGADPRDLERHSYMGSARYIDVAARCEGAHVVRAIDAQRIGTAAMMLGAGRKTKTDRIDHAVGIVLQKKRGDSIAPGEALARVYYAHTTSAQTLDEVQRHIQAAYSVANDAPTVPLIYEIL